MGFMETMKKLMGSSKDRQGSVDDQYILKNGTPAEKAEAIKRARKRLADKASASQGTMLDRGKGYDK